MSLMPIKSDSPSTNAKLMLMLCGKRCSIEPLMNVSSRRDMIRSVRRSRSLRSFSLSAAISFWQISQALPSPPMAVTFTVPGRGPHAALVATAVNDRRKLDAGILSAHVQSADAFGAVNLVPGNRHQVDAVFLDVHRNFADGLHAVHVEKNAFFFCDLANLRDGLDYADFVVGVHDGNQDGLGRDGFAQFVQVYAAVFLHREIGDFVTVFFEAFAGVERGLVLGDLRNNMIALLAIHFRRALDGQVGGFRRAAGEDDFLRRGVDELGYF